MKAEAKKPQLVRQWADWSLLRHAPKRYEIVRGDGSLSQAFEAKDEQAAITESCVIVKRLEKPASKTYNHIERYMVICPYFFVAFLRQNPIKAPSGRAGLLPVFSIHSSQSASRA